VTPASSAIERDIDNPILVRDRSEAKIIVPLLDALPFLDTARVGTATDGCVIALLSGFPVADLGLVGAFGIGSRRADSV
jgi:hypothetical protein